MTPEAGNWAVGQTVTPEDVARIFDVPAELVRTPPVATPDPAWLDEGIWRMLIGTYLAAVQQGVDVEGSDWPDLLRHNPLPPAQPERSMNGTSDQALTDYRLAHELCVWCGKHLRAVDDLFDSQDCQTSWHAARNGDPGWSRPEVGPRELLAVAPPGEVPPDVTAEPWFRPLDRPVSEATESAAMIGLVNRLVDYPGDPSLGPNARTGAERDATTQSQQDAVMAQELVAALRQRPGMLAPAPQVAGEGTAVGFSAIMGRPALRSISAEPQFDTYPHLRVAQMCSLADPPWRWTSVKRGCPTCNDDTTPCHVDRQYVSQLPMRLEANPEPSSPLHNAGFVRRVCCSVCGTPYPGPTVVALRRRGARGMDLWEYAAVTYRGGAVETVSGEVLDRATVPDMEGYVWDLAYQQAVHALLPTCHCRGCEGRAEQWWLVSGALQHGHCLWVPRDGEPLRVGMCMAHASGLRAALMRDTEYASRIEVGLSRDVLIVR